MPTNKIQSLPLTITGITSNSISFKWDRVPGYTANPDPIIYEIELREAENPNDSWHIIRRGTQLYSFTFTGLKANTMYAFHVKAYDESRKVAQYPFDIASRTAKTLTADTQAPTVSNKTIKVTRITQTSIAIQWEPATDNQTAAKDIRYQVLFKQSNTPSEPWRLVKDAKGITSHSFTGLKKGTTYSFHIKATDEAGNVLHYPLDNGCMSAKTLEAKADTNAPTVLSKKLDVVKVTENSISIQWEKAKDDQTLAKEIRYVVGLTEADNADDPWHIVDEAKDICEFTFKNLKANTRYAFYVMAFDEAGNMTQYPLDNGCMTAVTDSVNSKLVLQKGGTVYCDGIYGADSKSSLRENLGANFNRNYFEISFQFYPLATDKDSVQLDNIITLDSSRRVFGVHMKNGILQATVNNSYSYPIDMGFRYSPNKWQTLRMVYDNGKLTVNGAITRQIGKLNDPGNNILSSMNFSNGHAFKGYIKDLIVKTK